MKTAERLEVELTTPIVTGAGGVGYTADIVVKGPADSEDREVISQGS
jgi:hypothetical protein